MEANNYCKTREVLTRVHEFLSNLCRDDRCDAHCSECIGASDLADDVWEVLQMKPRNCDVGTVDEQTGRFVDFSCLTSHREVVRCATNWEQMPYEEGGSK